MPVQDYGGHLDGPEQYFDFGDPYVDGLPIDVLNNILLRQSPLPYSTIPVWQYGAPETQIVTPSEWDDISWNPPQVPGGGTFMDDPDPNAAPKPTWESIVETYREDVMTTGANRLEVHLSKALRYARRDFLLSEDLGGTPVHLGSGLDNMSSLTQIVARSEDAGETLSKVIMRTEDGDSTIDIWSQSELSDWLGRIGERANVVEGARNKVRASIQPQIDAIRDPMGGLAEGSTDRERLDAREAAWGRATMTIWEDAYSMFQSQAGAMLLAPEELPTDLRTLKKVYAERIEAASTGHQKYIKGALTQQSIDNWAPCVEVDDALQEVASRASMACLNVLRATTAQDATDEYDAGIASIQTVVPLDVPIWVVDSQDYHNPATLELSGQEVVVRARHPRGGMLVEGNVLIEADNEEGVVFAIPSDNSAAYEATLSIPEDATEGRTWTLTARNICGPSKMVLTLTP